MPTQLHTEFRARVLELKEGVVVDEAPLVHLTDEYLEFMQQKIDAEKPRKFKLTPTSPSGW